MPKERWAEIKTKYELGEPIRGLAKEYGIYDTTIHYRIKKEGWTQKLSAKVTDIKQNIQELLDLATPAQFPIVQDKLTEIVQLQKSVNNFIRGAVDLNLMNLRAALAEPDDEKRINLTSKMRATMADVSGIVNNRPTLPPDNSENPDKPKGITLYLPDNKRDKK